MDMLITLTVCILISFLFFLLARKSNFSVIIGLVFAGIVLGSTNLKAMVLEPNMEVILNLGDIGFIFLMFFAGLEISWSTLYKEKRDAAFVSLFAAFVPILLGFVIFLALGFPVLTSLTVGICMGVTAEATKAMLLIRLKKLKTKLGSIMLGAGIIDDILNVSLFILVSYLFTGIFITKETVLISSAAFAFFIGIMVHTLIGRARYEIKTLETFLMIFIIPFFFIAMGTNFNLGLLVQNPLILFVILFIAVAGKIVGTLLTKPFIKLRLKQLYLIGWGMNSRGAIELAIAVHALKIGLISSYIFSSLILMALITTIIFPFFVIRMIKKEPKIMG